MTDVMGKLQRLAGLSRLVGSPVRDAKKKSPKKKRVTKKKKPVSKSQWARLQRAANKLRKQVARKSPGTKLSPTNAKKLAHARKKLAEMKREWAKKR